MIPQPPAASDPLMVQYFTVLLVASLINLMVEVPNTSDALVLLITRSDTPVWFTLPSMVTLSAPSKSINGAAKSPVMLNPVCVG